MSCCSSFLLLLWCIYMKRTGRSIMGPTLCPLRVCSILLLCSCGHGAASRSSSSSLAFSTTLPEEMSWRIRAASAACSYIGLIAFVDRPRGVLRVVNGDEVEIRQSTVPGAGLGLFATKALKKHTILGTYPGVVLPLKQNLDKLRQYPSCESYIWRFSDKKFVIDPTDSVGALGLVSRGGNPSLPGSLILFRTLLFWMTVTTTLCRINEPPQGQDVNVVTQENLNTRCVTFTFEQDVKAGDELFMDYGVSYDRSMY